MTYQSDTLLMVQAADDTDDGLEVLAEPESVSERLLVFEFVLDSIHGVSTGDVGVDCGVPHVIVNPVEHPSEFGTMLMKGALEPATHIAVFYLFGVFWGHGCYKVRVDDSPLHEVDGPLVEIVLKAILPHELGRVETHFEQHMPAGGTLVFEVVQGVADSRAGHAQILINLEKQDGDQARLPIVTMDDIGMFV